MALQLMTSSTLNALKGWPQPYPVDFVAKLDSSVTARVPEGSCVSLNSSGNFILGVGNTNRMPMFTFHASDAPTVSNPNGGNPATDKRGFVPVNPRGHMLALVAVGPYELVSTNYDTGTSWAPNDFVTSPVSGGSEGKLTKGTLGTHTIIGQVSRGVVDNGYGSNALAFWPQVYPKYP